MKTAFVIPPELEILWWQVACGKPEKLTYYTTVYGFLSSVPQ